MTAKAQQAFRLSYLMWSFVKPLSGDITNAEIARAFEFADMILLVLRYFNQRNI